MISSNKSGFAVVLQGCLSLLKIEWQRRGSVFPHVTGNVVAERKDLNMIGSDHSFGVTHAPFSDSLKADLFMIQSLVFNDGMGLPIQSSGRPAPFPQ